MVNVQTPGRMTDQADPRNMQENDQHSDNGNTCNIPCENVLSGTMKKYTFLPEQNDDIWLFLHKEKKTIIDLIESELKKQNLKFFLCIKVIVKKYTITENGATTDYEDLYRRTSCAILLSNDNINEIIELSFNDLIRKIADYNERGSGWIVHLIEKLELYYGKYKPIGGQSYLPLPKELSVKKCLINIKNNDNKCFMWCVLAHLHPPKHKAERCFNYYKYCNDLNFSGIPFPVAINKVPLFERQNNIGVNVIGYDSVKTKGKKELFPLYISKHRCAPVHVNLLLLTEGNKSHYILIKKINALLKSGKTSKHYCIYCFHGFVLKKTLLNHIDLCKYHGAQKTLLPKESEKFLYFKDYSMVRRVPYVIYADFESVLSPVHTCTQRKGISSTTVKQIHIPCGYCFIVVSPFKIYEPRVYRGSDCISHFLKNLFKWEQKIIKRLKSPVKMRMTEADKLNFKQSKNCYMCGKAFDNIFNPPVRDHSHQSGLYQGCCHSRCNLNSKVKYFIPVILHNLKSYDSHLILKYMKINTNRRVSCIPSSKEKYISFSIGHLRFLDSFQFLPTSLETLVNNLAISDRSQFKALQSCFHGEQMELLLRKGVFPYSYCSSFDKFNDTCLPPKSAFYNDITKEELSDSDYAHAQKVWSKFNIKTLGEYHDLYVKSDTLSLCDVFESFRNVAHKEYNLDPCHFYTTPGFAFSACLYKTDIKLELITCPTIYLFIESALRGGVSQISKRYAKANNPYTSNYDPNLPSNYILYIDQNNLYGHALSQSLPYGGFTFLSEEEMQYLDIMNIPEDGKYGYIIQCDLQYDQKYHDRDIDFPLAVEKKKITKEMLSPYSLLIHEKLDTNIGNYEKLVPNLLDKKDYVCHYRNLQLYVELGMTISKVTRVLRFVQKPWLRSFIDFNTKKRAQAKNLFEKNLYKYIVNSIYGKSVQNNRKLVNIKLINNPDDVIKTIKKPTVKYWNHINANLAIFHMNKINIKLDKPIYVGFTVLELSKHLMYSFHYKHIKTKYGSKATLLMMDTDSFIYDIETDDIYEDMYTDRHLYDFSNYDKNHPLYSTMNAKRVGFMKDELQGDVIEEFVGLKPKMYSLISKSSAIKRAKGISKHVVEKDLTHEHYKNCLFKEQHYFYTMTYIQSKLHKLHTVDLHKKSLSPCDTKRYQLDAICSLPYGHYNIANK